MSTAVRIEGGEQLAAGRRSDAVVGRGLWALAAVGRLLRATWTGALVGFVVAALGASVLTSSALFLGAGAAVDMAAGGGVAGALFLAAWGLVRGVRWTVGNATGRLVARLPDAARAARPVRWFARWLRHPRRSSGLALAAFLWVNTLLLVPGLRALAPSTAYLPAIYVAAIAGGLFGLANHLWPKGPAGFLRPGRNAAAWLTAFVAFGVVASGLAWAALPGPGTAAATPPVSVIAKPTDLPDPGLPGPYRVLTTSYGSGIDARRPPFGPDAPIRTGTVDASRAVDPLPVPGDAYARWLVGSGLDRLPLNALVWHPEGPGPFPLVLIVHGNHAMGDFSEPGYAYLAEHLASRGFIAASVDEALLNGNPFGDLDGAEMPVRAWVLLHHLALWRGWNADPGSPFHGRVDLDHVALIGHSRGGEAAAVAAAMAPDDPGAHVTLTPFPTGLTVDAVVAIAPSDGQIEGAGYAPNRLEGVDYLTIQGGEDADMAWWSSLRQLARTRVDGSSDFKAGLWIRRANHGRFNTAWDLGDAGPHGDWLLDQASVLSMPDQQDVAKTAIAGFLEASLMGRHGYRDLFAVPAVGREWFPSDSYVTRLVEGSTTMLADAESSTSGKLEGGPSTRVFKQDLMTRAEGVSQLNRAAKVTWSGETGVASLAVPPGTVPGGLAATLRFAIATASVDAADPVPAVTVELVDGAGRTAAIPLEAYGGVFPPMPSSLYKSREVARLAMLDEAIATDAETHLQTFALPVAAFTATSLALDPSSLREIRFRFAGPAGDGIFLDEIGIDPS